MTRKVPPYEAYGAAIARLPRSSAQPDVRVLTQQSAPPVSISNAYNSEFSTRVYNLSANNGIIISPARDSRRYFLVQNLGANDATVSIGVQQNANGITIAQFKALEFAYWAPNNTVYAFSAAGTTLVVIEG